MVAERTQSMAACTLGHELVKSLSSNARELYDIPRRCLWRRVNDEGSVAVANGDARRAIDMNRAGKPFKAS